MKLELDVILILFLEVVLLDFLIITYACISQSFGWGKCMLVWDSSLLIWSDIQCWKRCYVGSQFDILHCLGYTLNLEITLLVLHVLSILKLLIVDVSLLEGRTVLKALLGVLFSILLCILINSVYIRIDLLSLLEIMRRVIESVVITVTIVIGTDVFKPEIRN